MERNDYIQGITEPFTFLGKLYATTDPGQRTLNECLIECAGGRSTYETHPFQLLRTGV